MARTIVSVGKDSLLNVASSELGRELSLTPNLSLARPLVAATSGVISNHQDIEKPMF